MSSWQIVWSYFWPEDMEEKALVGTGERNIIYPMRRYHFWEVFWPKADLCAKLHIKFDQFQYKYLRDYNRDI